MAGLKRDRLDAVFSDLVRERAGWKSELSGSNESLQCCHIYSRKFLSTRWHPLNAVCLTASEHAHFTDRPPAFTNFLNAKFGPDHMFELAQLANKPRKFSQSEREGLYQHYKEELKLMREMREEGVTHRLSFNWPDPIVEAQPRKRKNVKKVSRFKKKLNGEVVLRGVKVTGKRDTEAA
jgi:hypothetical protein